VTTLRRAAGVVVSIPARILAGLIVGYRRFITPYTPQTCRFYPTCSSYGLTAIRTHGALKGTLLTSWRVLRCHPWTPGGVDHVPPRGHWHAPTETTERPLVGPPLTPPTGA
jgi:uncharacterized protein